jgi:predicted transposase/invertase (TIGR01784 family)
VPKLLDPTLDVVFKLLFTSDPDSAAALCGLVAAVLRAPQPVASVQVLNPDIGKEAIDDKGIVLDILVRFLDGTILNVEMQARNVTPFRERLLYYWARVFGQQLAQGEGYTALRPTISVAFLSYREIQNPRFHSIFRILETHDHQPYSDALEIHLVQLPRLDELTDPDRSHDAALLRWSRFFAARSAEEIDEAAMDDPAVSKARDILHRLSADPDAQRMAEARELAQITRRIEDSALREEAEAIGEERGLRVGEEIGEERGLRLGEERGLRLGEELGLRTAIRSVCSLLGLVVDETRAEFLDQLDADALRAFLDRLTATRAWP